MAAVAGLAVAVPVATSADASARGNLGRARVESARLLSLLRLPPGAVALSANPSGDRGALAIAGYDPATPNLVDDHRWWTVRGRAVQVLRYVTSRLPHDAKLFTFGSGGPRPTYQTKSFALAPIPGVLSERVLSVTVVELSSTTTWVRTDGEAVWIVPRPASEKVPPGVHEIDISSGHPRSTPLVTVTVTEPSQVEQIVSWLDALGIAQPGSFSCPALGGPTVTIDFRSVSGALLARASGMDFDGTSGECNPIGFSIRGQTQHPLLGGFVGRVERLLGIRFETGSDKQPTTTASHPSVRDVLGADGIGDARFGESLSVVRAKIDSLLGQRGNVSARTPAQCGLDQGVAWDDHTPSGLLSLTATFDHSKFVGYQYGEYNTVNLRPRPPLQGVELATTRGLRIGDKLTRGRQLYGHAFALSSEQGGVWKLGTGVEPLRGYAWGHPSYGDVSWQSVVATIDAGDVGCPALSP